MDIWCPIRFYRQSRVQIPLSLFRFVVKVFLLDKFLLENNKGIEGIESFSDGLSLVSYLWI